MENAFEEDWKVVMNLLPSGWLDRARQSGAVERLRVFSPGDRGARQGGRARGRFRWRSVKALALCGSLVTPALCTPPEENPGGLPDFPRGKTLRVVEATVVKEPGPTGSLWRLHYSLQIPSLLGDSFELTPTQGEGSGESFRRFPVSPHDFVLGDAGYCTPGRVEYLSRQGAYVLVRANAQSLPLHSPGGAPWAILPHLHSLAEVGRIAAWEVAVRGPQRQCQADYAPCARVNTVFVRLTANCDAKPVRRGSPYSPRLSNMPSMFWFSPPFPRRISPLPKSWNGVACAGKWNWSLSV